MGRKTKKDVANLTAEQITALQTWTPMDETQTLLMAPSAETTTEVVEDVVARLEAIETETVGPMLPDDGVDRRTTEDAGPETQPISFDDVLKAISDEDATAMATRTAAALDERADFESVKDPDNANIHRTLKKARAQMVTARAGRVLIATNVDPSFLNRTIHEGARYNVYAIGKLADVIYGLTDGAIKNAINNACTRSLFQCSKAKVTFTGDLAKAAASDKIKVDAAIRAHLVRHTVSASTAPTQASSTMQALETLGVVTRSGSGKNPTFTLTANPVVGKLETALAA